jgi:hypothetical protein
MASLRRWRRVIPASTRGWRSIGPTVAALFMSLPFTALLWRLEAPLKPTGHKKGFKQESPSHLKRSFRRSSHV